MNHKLCSRPISTAASRREFLYGLGASLGSVAFSDMLAAETGSAGPLTPRQPMNQPKAKNVIMLFMEGGPGQWIPSIPNRSCRNCTRRNPN